MENNAVFRQRKELKKRGHAVVKNHYLLLVFLCLVLALFGDEYNYSFSAFETSVKTGNILEVFNQPNSSSWNILSADNTTLPGQVLSRLFKGDVKDASLLAEESAQKLRKESEKNQAMGMTQGVLAQVANTLMSGRFMAMLGQAVYSITRSDKAVAVIFVISSFAFYALIFVLLKNVYSAVIRRVFLETRVYKRVPLTDALHFAVVGKWLRACWVMAVSDFYLVLWSLTIVGGLIKSFSYWAVPYIVAENPALGANETVSLSRRMMNGHKMELFKFELSMAGWILLGAVTLGISDLVYGLAYRMACFAEFYAKIREGYLHEHPEEAALLNDPYLFAQADRVLLYETYFDVVDEITLLHENKIELPQPFRFVAQWFGVWIGSYDKKKQYDDQEGRREAIRRCRQSMLGEAYPQWLNPLWTKKEIRKTGHFSSLRNYTVWSLFLLFIIFCFIGWSWEVALHYIQTGQFANRGTLHGPWLPIYGGGGVIALCLCNRFRKNPVLEFLFSTTLCGVLEYFSAWSLETRYHQRWWSYEGYFLNLHGRICAEGLLVFGIACCLVVYLIAPVFDFLISRVKQRILVILCAVLAVFFAGDFIYSLGHPNVAEGAVEAPRISTEETG